ncbi:SMI1/KNR4 family protein [Bacillus atrophaeus]|uniref:SMI1/KNR4 family protein n=1 Tax=Bacillus atrophaeus TaxID=1452 RepID=UPI000D03D501|nr:SMI1/KNR4 family protein [Bacillus atrophaeus]PRS09664.1 SMI1/KNR4 family protein [Bacillus atrophaeus]
MSFQDINNKMSEFELKYYGEVTYKKSSKAIEEFEKELGIEIDELFKQFTLYYGGSNILADNVVFPVLEKNPWAVENKLRLGIFYGFGLDDDDFNIATLAETYEDQMPDWIIPIADADAGNQICLGIKGKGSGKVYFWDHELTNGIKDTFLIADSFEDFIQILSVEEDSDEEDDGILFMELDDDLLNS